jgi:formate dehydrogenase major subunit
MAKLPVLSDWPVVRQVAARDPSGLGGTAATPRTRGLAPRTASADRVARSICPYCAVGCGQLVYVKGERIIDVEGDPDSPISQGCLCPKGAATFQLVTGSHRVKQALHRRPGGTEWEPIALERAMDMIADRVAAAREEGWEERVEVPGAEHEGKRVRRTTRLAHLGGATLDDEENYLLKKLYCALGVVQVENQARI